MSLYNIITSLILFFFLSVVLGILGFFIFQAIKIISKSFGTVDYKKGEIIIDTVNITSTTQPDNIVEVQAIPESNDVLARKELYLQFDVSKSNFYMRQDSIASGANTSGTRYNPQSSYQNGSKTR